MIPAFQRLRSSHGTSSSPSMNRRDRIDIGSANSRNRSASPRAANPSISSWASLGIMSPVRDSTARGRNGASTTRRSRSWSGPSDPSMFLPIVRLSVDGSVSPVNTSGVTSTWWTSSKRVTSHRSTAGTQLTGSSSRRRR